MSRSYFFLGGVFPLASMVEYLSKSKGAIQNAADALQKNIIQGLDLLVDGGVTVINLPFLGSFPKFYTDFFVSPVSERIGGRSLIRGVGYLNIKFLRIFSRFFSSFLAGFVFIRSGNSVLFIYSAHMPFLISALFLRFLKRGLRVCLILPDLPEYMGGGYRGILGFLKKVEVFLFYAIVRKFDCHVVLAHAMADRIGLDENRFVVVEGVADAVAPDVERRLSDDKCIFLYTGTLAARYGIELLLKAFSSLDAENLELWICGEGDARLLVTEAAARDNRIKYFGQVSREKARAMQARADFLVNPRPPDDFTKYSFPSKILEYLVTGRVLIMFKLEGVGEEYSPFFVAPDSISAEAFAASMEFARKLPLDAREEMGARARDFVLLNKTCVPQVRKIIELVEGCF